MINTTQSTFVNIYADSCKTETPNVGLEYRGSIQTVNRIVLSRDHLETRHIVLPEGK